MKILSIRLKNLHSLRDEWHIPFTENPLRGAGIFAITGPTGAGKSTILDAVTLALYGKVPRNSEKGEVMSHHTGECWAEVDFETAAGQFRARWSLTRAHRKPEGNLQPVQMSLAQLPSEQILHSGTTEVTSAVENLTGLDFARFTQSVLLSQGEFAKFLKADSNDRADLLERITGTHIYADLSKKCYEIAKGKLEHVVHAQAGLRTGLLSEEQVQQVNQQLHQLRQQSNQLAEQAQTLQKQKQWLEQIQLLQQQIGQEKQQQQQLEEQTAQLQPQLQRLHRHEQALQFAPEHAEYKQLMKVVAELEKTKKELTENNSVLANELRKITEDEKKLKQRSDAAQNLLQQQQPLITQTIELDVELKQVQKTLADIQNQWHETTEKLTRQREQLRQNQATAQQQQQQMQELTAFLQNNRHDEGLVAALPLLQEQLSNIAQMNGQLAQQEQKELKAHQEIRQFTNQIEQSATELQQQQLQVTQYSNQLQQSEAELMQYPPLQALNSRVSEIEKWGMTLKRQKQLSETYLEQCGILEKLREEFTALQQQVKEKEEALRHTTALHLEAEAHQGSIERQLQAERMAAKYEQDRLTLVSGQPCPLCGSTEHPFAHSHTAVEISQTEAQLKEQQQKVKNLQTEKNNLEKNISLLKQQCEQTEKNGKTKKTELETQVVKEFNQLNTELNAQHNINNPHAFEDLLAEKRQELQTVKKQIDMREQADKKLQEVKEQLGKVKEQVLKIQAEVRLTQQKAVNAQKDLSDAQAAIKEQRQDINQRNAQINALLQPYGQQLPGNAAQIEGLIQQLQQRAQQYQTRATEKNNLQTQMAAVSSAIEGFQKNVSELQNSLTGIETRKAEQQNRVTQLQNKRQTITASFIHKDPQQEKTRLETERDNARTDYQQLKEEHTQKGARLNMQKDLLHQKSEELERKTELLNYTGTELIGKIQPAGFQTLLMLDESYITDAEEVAQVKQIEQNIKKQTEQLKGSLKSAENTLQTTLALQLTTQTPEEINLQLEETQNQKQTADQSTGQLTQQLEQDKQLKAENETLLAEIEKLQAEHTRWKKLSAIIGSASGQEFKRFAQDITLQQLILQANRHLRKLNDRYQIRKKTDKELEMEIIDMYQANVSRSVKTLSGGESFLVSLALALGLSDLAGRKTKIESLFIDEGFGTLDTGTLDIAITTLENLQAQGKMIGVISHVEMLKERITTQIQVHKKSNGASVIAIETVSHYS